MEDLHPKLEAFFSQYKIRSYKKHDIILHEDDIPSGIYYIKSGYLRLYSLSPEGEEITRLILGPRDLFPLRWVFAQEPINYYAEPITDVVSWYAPKEAFMEFVTKDAALLLEFTKLIVHRMGTLYKRMEYFVFGDAYQKVASIVVALAKRFGKETTQGIQIEIPLTHHEIASLVGVSRETVTMELEKLRQKGLLRHESHIITVKNLPALEEISHVATAI